MTLNILIYILQYWNPGRSIQRDFSIYPNLYTLLQTYFIRVVAIHINNNKIKEIIPLLKQSKALKNQLRKEKLTTETVANAN
jgi:hypothetical protein